MASPKVSKITNKKQFEVMVEFMVRNSRIARGMKIADHCNVNIGAFNEKWTELTIKLNSCGPPMRTSSEWQKVWSDYKLKTKKKLAFNKKTRNATGGGPSQIFSLSSMEEQVADLLALDVSIPQSSRVFGMENLVSEDNQMSDSGSADIPSTAGPSAAGLSTAEPCSAGTQGNQNIETAPSSSNKKRRFENIEFRNDQIQIQSNLLSETKIYLKKISDNIEIFVKSSQQITEAKLKEINLKCEILAIKKRKLDESDMED